MNATSVVQASTYSTCTCPSRPILPARCPVWPSRSPRARPCRTKTRSGEPVSTSARSSSRRRPRTRAERPGVGRDSGGFPSFRYGTRPALVRTTRLPRRPVSGRPTRAPARRPAPTPPAQSASGAPRPQGWCPAGRAQPAYLACAQPLRHGSTRGRSRDVPPLTRRLTAWQVRPGAGAGLRLVVLRASAFPEIRVAAPQLGVVGLSFVRPPPPGCCWSPAR